MRAGFQRGCWSLSTARARMPSTVSPLGWRAPQMTGMEAMAHQVPLQAQILGQGHAPRAPHMFQHHMQHQRAAQAQCGQGLCRRVRAGRLQRLHDATPTVSAPKAASTSGASGATVRGPALASRPAPSTHATQPRTPRYPPARWRVRPTRAADRPRGRPHRPGPRPAPHPPRRPPRSAPDTPRHAPGSGSGKCPPPTSGNSPMLVSGMAILVRSVTMRQRPPWLMPIPPPMTMPSMKAIYGLG